MSRNVTQHGPGASYRLHPAGAGPEATDRDLAVIPGEKPGTAVRVRRGEGDDADSVWLEQLAFNPGVGWYRQRSFPVPRQMLKEVGQALKLADCLAAEGPEDPTRPEQPSDAPTLRFPEPRRASG